MALFDNCISCWQFVRCSVTTPFLSLQRVWLARRVMILQLKECISCGGLLVLNNAKQVFLFRHSQKGPKLVWTPPFSVYIVSSIVGIYWHPSHNKWNRPFLSIFVSHEWSNTERWGCLGLRLTWTRWVEWNTLHTQVTVSHSDRLYSHMAILIDS